MSERVSIEALRPGMVITRITQQNGPVSIRKSGLVSSQAMVQGLAEMGVQEVEIDPHQTVEIDARLQHRTQTQQLLRGDHDKRSGIDAGLSEQFNRSLFLPTVQGLPPAWHRIGKSAGAYVVLAMLGLLLGFAGGTAHVWWPRLMQSPPVQSAPVSQIPAAENSAGESANAGKTVSDERDENAVSSTEPAAQNPAQTEQTQTEVGRDAEDITAQQNQTSPQADLSEPDTAASAPAQDTERPGDESESTYAGEVLNQPEVPSDSQVSQALLEKFNRAIEELDNNSDEEAQRQPETRVTVSQSLQRVDQLPVRMLTRLPTMKFSAHMYASNPSDRWVKVNGKQLGEGDWIADKVQIVAIEGQRVVLEFEDERFTMAALTDW
ncbi:general secretion pathway protein GspB [Salinimonas chungwhensis]|uniref:general secretion pathway protein GspB n=1 Tax=Salinimonas chungwhensis TaxID=265425 RepID=UPI00036BD20A|nr:general secretion pathway protein GspB [Salinimonas chungwhensis]